MLSNLATALYATLALSSIAWAAVSPTSPSGDTVVRVGQPLNALWTVDGTGEWTDVVVQLMTGDNLQVSQTRVFRRVRGLQEGVVVKDGCQEHPVEAGQQQSGG